MLLQSMKQLLLCQLLQLCLLLAIVGLVMVVRLLGILSALSSAMRGPVPVLLFARSFAFSSCLVVVRVVAAWAGLACQELQQLLPHQSRVRSEGLVTP